ncbi:MAG: hypothetical protein IPK63_09515 [Candidatus Competibacteraceae bacterium]|nr:hypothetical protein [Candidatus Competibacteraceae bacterium]
MILKKTPQHFEERLQALRVELADKQQALFEQNPDLLSQTEAIAQMKTALANRGQLAQERIAANAANLQWRGAKPQLAPLSYNLHQAVDTDHLVDLLILTAQPVLEKLLEADIKRLIPDSLPDSSKRQALRKQLEVQINTLEREEEKLIRTLEAQGREFYRRADAPPAIVLAPDSQL